MGSRRMKDPITGKLGNPAIHDAAARAKCPTPSKLPHESKRDAKRSIKRSRRLNQRDEVTSYRCECGAWHIGHNPGTARKLDAKKRRKT